MGLDLVPLEDLMDEIFKRCECGFIVVDPSGGDSGELLAKWIGCDYKILGLIEKGKNIFYENNI